MDEIRQSCGCRKPHIEDQGANERISCVVAGRNHAEESSGASEIRFRELVDLLPQIVFEIDISGNIFYSNSNGFNAFGYTQEEFRDGLHVSRMIIPEDRARAWKNINLVLSGGINTDNQYTALRKDGSTFPVIIYSTPIVQQEQVVGLRGIVVDNTQHKKVEEALQTATLKAYEEKSKADAIIAAMVDAIGIQDTDFRILYQNQIHKDLMGDHKGRYCFQAYRQRDNICIDCPMVSTFGDGGVHTLEKSDVVNGEMVHVEIRTSPIRDSSGKIVSGIEIVRDVTNRKRLEDQFRQAQKMEAVGTLTGGIAHDFNNLLTAVTGYSEILLARMGPDDPMCRDVLEIKKAGDRASALTRQLLAFSRKQILKPKVLNLNDVISNIETMLLRLIGEDMSFSTILEKRPWNVRVDPGQIEQVIMNLVVNSKDAMPEGGTLVIRTANAELGEECVHEHPYVKPGRYVMMEVSDTGCGMDKETQAHVFEPFYTTKESGKGTGLGLSTVYGIVKQSRGYIWVVSEPGQGTRFQVYLPQVEDLPEIAASPEEPQSVMNKASETILLSEDEELVRVLVRTCLESRGYKILEARDGKHALEIGMTHDGPIHLLLTDIVMPQMNGQELATRLTQAHPELKTLFMSGYAKTAMVQDGIMDEGIHFIQKPFRVNSLVRKVREVPDSPRNGHGGYARQKE